MRRASLPLAALSLCLAGPARAAFEDLGFGARAMGMGDALTADAGELGAMTLNPAGLGQLRRSVLETGFRRQFQTPAGSRELDGMILGVAAPITHPSFPGALGAHWTYDGVDDDLALDRVLGLTLATRSWRELGPGTFDVGATLKALTRSGRRFGGRAKKAAVDLGAYYRWGEDRALGLSVLNINSPQVTAGPVDDAAPSVLKLGFVQSLRRFAVSLELSKREPSRGLGAGESGAIGVEHAWGTAKYGSFTARSGLILGGEARSWSLGGGWSALGTRLDYAVRIPIAGDKRWSHAVSLSYRFGAWDPEAEYERLITHELRYREELSRALEAAEIKQWKLAEELRVLREEITELRTTMALREAEAVETEERLKAAREKLKLKEIEERRAEAERRLESMRREAERLRELDRKARHEEAMAGYRRVKEQGVSDLVLIDRLQQILREFKGQGVDLGEAHKELRRLMRQ